MNSIPSDSTMTARLRSVPLQPARPPGDVANDEVAGTPYWSPCPSCALGHRVAAHAARAEADLLLAAS